MLRAARSLPALLLLLSAVAFTGTSRAAAPKLELKRGDHVVFVGNTLAERMIWFPHFETNLHARFPEHQLVVRNMGWSADEVKLRPRPLNFGSPDEHLTQLEADVILLFFGGNEAFQGEDGLAQFEKDLTEHVKHLQGQQYNGRTAPRIAIVSPIAMEDVGNPHHPDGTAHNADLETYTAAMKQVAEATGVAFADVFTPTREAFSQSDRQFTINGVHLNEEGYRDFGRLLTERLFGPAESKVGSDQFAALHEAVRAKNEQWWYRHRAVNGEYIYGRRKKPFGVKNFPQEMQKLDQMVANRDRWAWAVAQGDLDAEVDDSNLIELKPMPTNFERPIDILPPEESKKKLNVHADYEVNLFASEVEFPELKNPVAIAWDPQGRLWVTVMPTYPQYLPGDPPKDKILILEDTDRDGKADELTVFADGLHVPLGLELGDGGVYVSQPPNLWFMQDLDGDDKADLKRIVLHGFGTEDSHHAISAFTWSPGGVLHFQEGTFHHSQVETPWGPTRLVNAGVFGYEPRRERLEAFVSYNFANPWGHTYDKWGQNFVADASGGANYFGTAFSGHVQYPHKHARMKQFIKKRVRPTCGCQFVYSSQWPDEAQGNFLLNNTIGFQGVLQHTVAEEGSGFAGTEIEPILVSSDPNFRPTDLEFGPDGCLYVVDWFNPLIGHMQHNLRDPNRDHNHGRIWRVKSKEREPLPYPKIAGQPIPQLLELLKAYEDRTRYWTRLELRERPTKEVVDGIAKWLKTLDPKDPEVEHHRLEALWVHQHHDVVNEELLKELLRSKQPEARAAATRVLCYWRGRVDGGLELLRTQANDEHPRVRLEAVRAASFFVDEPTLATEVALESLKHEQDDYLKYTLNETLQTLERAMKGAE